MLARTSEIRHRASGVHLRTPLLIPSFSSKGFTPSAGASDVGRIFDVAAGFITSTCLISAFDIVKEHLPPPPDFKMKPDLFVVDSGGYEISDDHDLSAVIRTPPPDREWTRELLEGVLDAWPKETPAIFVSNDDPRHPRTFEEQLDDARQLFKGRQHQLNTFLMKPETREQSTIEKTLLKAMSDINQLGSFDIIGVTEKDLGTSMLDRMERIAQLRMRMDESKLTAPIHVFGALDPLTACLYFMSGAEIFDGLTWLRYAYDGSGRCVYIHNHGALEHGLQIRDHVIRARTLSANYYYLLELEQKLRVYESKGDLSGLPSEGKLKNAIDQLETRLNVKGRA